MKMNFNNVYKDNENNNKNQAPKNKLKSFKNDNIENIFQNKGENSIFNLLEKFQNQLAKNEKTEETKKMKKNKKKAVSNVEILKFKKSSQDNKQDNIQENNIDNNSKSKKNLKRKESDLKTNIYNLFFGPKNKLDQYKPSEDDNAKIEKTSKTKKDKIAEIFNTEKKINLYLNNSKPGNINTVKLNDNEKTKLKESLLDKSNLKKSNKKHKLSDQELDLQLSMMNQMKNGKINFEGLLNNQDMISTKMEDYSVLSNKEILKLVEKGNNKKGEKLILDMFSKERNKEKLKESITANKMNSNNIMNLEFSKNSSNKTLKRIVDKSINESLLHVNNERDNKNLNSSKSLFYPKSEKKFNLINEKNRNIKFDEVKNSQFDLIDVVENEKINGTKDSKIIKTLKTESSESNDDYELNNSVNLSEYSESKHLKNKNKIVQKSNTNITQDLNKTQKKKFEAKIKIDTPDKSKQKSSIENENDEFISKNENETNDNLSTIKDFNSFLNKKNDVLNTLNNVDNKILDSQNMTNRKTKKYVINLSESDNTKNSILKKAFFNNKDEIIKDANLNNHIKQNTLNDSNFKLNLKNIEIENKNATINQNIKDDSNNKNTNLNDNNLKGIMKNNNENFYKNLNSIKTNERIKTVRLISENHSNTSHTNSSKSKSRVKKSLMSRKSIKEILMTNNLVKNSDNVNKENQEKIQNNHDNHDNQNNHQFNVKIKDINKNINDDEYIIFDEDVGIDILNFTKNIIKEVVDNQLIIKTGSFKELTIFENPFLKGLKNYFKVVNKRLKMKKNLKRQDSVDNEKTCLAKKLKNKKEAIKKNIKIYNSDRYSESSDSNSQSFENNQNLKEKGNDSKEKKENTGREGMNFINKNLQNIKEAGNSKMSIISLNNQSASKNKEKIDKTDLYINSKEYFGKYIDKHILKNEKIKNSAFFKLLKAPEISKIYSEFLNDNTKNEKHFNINEFFSMKNECKINSHNDFLNKYCSETYFDVYSDLRNSLTDNLKSRNGKLLENFRNYSETENLNNYKNSPNKNQNKFFNVSSNKNEKRNQKLIFKSNLFYGKNSDSLSNSISSINDSIDFMNSKNISTLNSINFVNTVIQRDLYQGKYEDLFPNNNYYAFSKRNTGEIDEKLVTKKSFKNSKSLKSLLSQKTIKKQTSVTSSSVDILSNIDHSKKKLKKIDIDQKNLDLNLNQHEVSSKKINKTQNIKKSLFNLNSGINNNIKTDKKQFKTMVSEVNSNDNDESSIEEKKLKKIIPDKLLVNNSNKSKIFYFN